MSLEKILHTEMLEEICDEINEELKRRSQETSKESVNGTQQLKAEIATLVNEHSSLAAVSSQSYLNLVNKLRQLSAV